MRTVRCLLPFAFGLLAVSALAATSAGPVSGTAGDDLLGQTASICAATQISVLDGLTRAREPKMLTCLCKAPQQTPGFTGTGSTCTQADGSVFSQGNAWIYDGTHCVNTDGICYESSVIVTQACFFNTNTGLYQETGHLVFKCLFCD